MPVLRTPPLSKYTTSPLPSAPNLGSVDAYWGKALEPVTYVAARAPGPTREAFNRTGPPLPGLY